MPRARITGITAQYGEALSVRDSVALAFSTVGITDERDDVRQLS